MSEQDPQDELEPGPAVEAELGRIVHDPRAEAHRLEAVGAEGETGSTPFIEIGVVLRVLVPIFLVMLAIALVVYYAVR